MRRCPRGRADGSRIAESTVAHKLLHCARQAVESVLGNVRTGCLLDAPGEAREAAGHELGELKRLRERAERVRGHGEVHVDAAVVMHVGREHALAELQPQSDLADRWLAGDHDRLCPAVLPARPPAPESYVLERIMFVRHVADAQGVLPGLARVLRVEPLCLHVHRRPLRPHALGTELLRPVDGAVAHGPEALETLPGLVGARLRNLVGVDHFDHAGPVADVGGGLGDKVVDAFGDPRTP
mmetsp:Transcript_73318/g.184771  ORF Transcript_73318/g.184771 Transcript_73318/m.184771 type:complete len:240 (-) Transcript_73318:593-1312(-)